MRPLKYIQFTLALLLASSAGYAQNYPCLDYGRINRAYECQFDLLVGEMRFTGGVVQLENTLNQGEIDRIIEDAVVAGTVRRGGRPGNAPHPCSLVDSLNRATSEMEAALGLENSMALWRIIRETTSRLEKDFASAATPPYISVVQNLAEKNRQDLAFDLVGRNIGAFYHIFSDVFAGAKEAGAIMDAIEKNRPLIERGQEAQQVLDELYRDVNEAVKKKMREKGEMRWSMTLRNLDGQTIGRTLMGVPVEVEYKVALDMKNKAAHSETCEGSYEGSIKIEMEMMPGKKGECFDDRFPKDAEPVKNAIKRVFIKSSGQWDPKLHLVRKSPTTFRLNADLVGAKVKLIEPGTCIIDWVSIDQRPELHLDYDVKVAARNDSSATHDFTMSNLRLTSGDPQKASIKTLDSRDTMAYLHKERSGLVWRIKENAGYLEGWGEDVKFGGHDFLEPLKSAAYIVVWPKEGR